jgi:NAD(P)-dependent dehydrogenase (short-subunit alcohol dehydrogenase family)
MVEGFIEQRLNLQGKVAAIIGGGGGLGRACTVDLAKAGMDVAVLDRNEELLAACVRLVEEAGSGVLATAADGRDPEVLERFFAELDGRFGRLDVLVNVVGGTFNQPFADTKPRGWEALMRANFTWVLYATHLAIPRMRAVGGGSIMSLTSIEGHRAAPGYAVYAGMKAGVVNFSRTLAVELAPEGIRVNTIAPDHVPTEGTNAQHMAHSGSAWSEDPTTEDRYAVTIPMGRRGTYEDVGSCAIFLASDLSKYITGTSLHPDGGALASSGWLNWPGHGFDNVPPTGSITALGDGS